MLERFIVRFNFWDPQKGPKPEKPEKPEGQEVTAVYANRFSLTLGDMTRITFGECVIGLEPAHYHTAIALRTSDAVELANIIIKLNNKVNPPKTDES